MEMIPVKSAAVTHVGHDGQDLHVTYRGGRDYVHAGVPAHVFQGLLDTHGAGESVGNYIAAKIRKQYPATPK